ALGAPRGRPPEAAARDRIREARRTCCRSRRPPDTRTSFSAPPWGACWPPPRTPEPTPPRPASTSSPGLPFSIGPWSILLLCAGGGSRGRVYPRRKSKIRQSTIYILCPDDRSQGVSVHEACRLGRAVAHL